MAYCLLRIVNKYFSIGFSFSSSPLNETTLDFFLFSYVSQNGVGLIFPSLVPEEVQYRVHLSASLTKGNLINHVQVDQTIHYYLVIASSINVGFLLGLLSTSKSYHAADLHNNLHIIVAPLPIDTAEERGSNRLTTFFLLSRKMTVPDPYSDFRLDLLYLC